VVRDSVRPIVVDIFDAFPDDSGRQAHLNGKVCQAPAENSGRLFEQPTVEQVEVVAERAPE
jgi:hypothetical protein